ncbi:MAG: nucleotidyltransferase family protein [Planctomycetes bacterium]|nr:nucleotidyltransferase family protein [Planctomycetota bacterium]
MKAMILAAGFGTRLGNLTRETPKPMLPICDRPLLEYNLRYLASYGFDEVMINLHFMPHVIRDYFGDGSRFALHVHYSVEEKLLGTAGGVRNVESFLAGEEEFLVMYGDLLIDQDLSVMLQFHREKKADATLLVHRRKKSNSIIELADDGRVTSFLERPGEDVLEEYARKHGEFYVNSVLQIMNWKVLEGLNAGVAADLPKDVYIPQLNRFRFFGYPLSGFRVAIDSEERYRMAEDGVRCGDYKVSLPES